MERIRTSIAIFEDNHFSVLAVLCAITKYLFVLHEVGAASTIRNRRCLSSWVCLLISRTVMFLCEPYKNLDSDVSYLTMIMYINVGTLTYDFQSYY